MLNIRDSNSKSIKISGLNKIHIESVRQRMVLHAIEAVRDNNFMQSNKKDSIISCNYSLEKGLRTYFKRLCKV